MHDYPPTITQKPNKQQEENLDPSPHEDGKSHLYVNVAPPRTSKRMKNVKLLVHKQIEVGGSLLACVCTKKPLRSKFLGGGGKGDIEGDRSETQKGP